MVTVKEKPPRHAQKWSADPDRLAKFRSQTVKRALGPNGQALDWPEKSRLDREIKRLVRAKKHSADRSLWTICGNTLMHCQQQM